MECSSLSVEFGRRMRAARVERGLTLDDVGRRVGLSWQQIQKYEVGMSDISLPRLYQIAAALGCSIGSLLPDSAGSAAPAASMRAQRAVAGFANLRKPQQAAIAGLVAAVEASQS